MLLMSHFLMSSLALCTIENDIVPCLPLKLSQANGSEIRESSGYWCGDDRCWCNDDKADCSGSYGIHTYVPKLPKSIKYLNFNGNKLNSMMLTQDFFTNASRISGLQLAYNNLTGIPRVAFHQIRNLTLISVDHNKNLTLNGIRNLLRISSLRTLHAENCNLGPLPRSGLSGTDSRVTQLFLANNRMLTVNLALFLPLRRLDSLHLNDNGLRSITSDSAVRLKRLNLYHNPIQEIPKTCHSGISLFPELEFLSLKRTYISDLSVIQGDVCLPKLQRLVLSYNLIWKIHSRTFTHYRFPKLSALLLRNGILSHLDENAFQNSQLLHLSLFRNWLNFGLKERINSKAFANCPKLAELNLGGNLSLIHI